MRSVSTIAVMVGLALLAGCESSSKPVEVSGTVTIDSQPLSDGQIVFEAADGNTTPAGGTIKGGQYSLKVLPGAKKVKITASRPGKKIDPVMGAAPMEPLIGPDYNTNTKLTADIQPGVNANVNFEVKAIPNP
jgi:hypothetical protein